MYKNAVCFYDKAKEQCGEERAKAIMKEYDPYVSPAHLCRCCKDVIQFMENLGLHVSVKGGKGKTCSMSDTVNGCYFDDQQHPGDGQHNGRRSKGNSLDARYFVSIVAIFALCLIV
ncbi:hypothetical protein DdX_19310 [Ditylenchus destructor]|uniref:Uncharacterized protein n=1 Tax=Ditylenchus destructor TaxID=166010 RepID=A0AAD4QXD1_9BILA|nr:hypothetical protein DdX_19310 [Ditylenchus destructor]